MRIQDRSVPMVLALVSLAWLFPLPAAAQGGPVRGGTLVAAISADPGHLNPAITTSGATHTAAELPLQRPPRA